MNLLAPAKINLHLRVGPRRADGFHPLASWMCTVGLFDKLTLEPAHVEPGSSDVLLTCDAPGLPVDQTNLVVRMAAGYLETARSSGDLATDVGVRATLAKRIPMGGGLGGGSSDGARTLVGLNRLFRTNWAAKTLSAFAARFGSDIPFFIHGPSSICRGRGEEVRPVPPPRANWTLLILPTIEMPTPAVYRKFDEMGLGDAEVVAEGSDAAWENWGTLPAVELLTKLVNDLEPPAFAMSPALADLRQSAETLLGRTVRMSGSGSSLFTLFDSSQEAAAATEQIERSFAVRALAAQLAPIISDDL
jgi:4-diphosphocytidyl-2-C-methyl-D-erythritol kinase